MTHATVLLALLTAAAGPARAKLAGKVVDAAQKPIPQATVFIYTAWPRVGPGVLCPGCYVDCGKKAATDTEGRFLVAGLAPDLLFRVLVVAEGFRPQFAKDVDPLKGPLDVKLRAMPSDLSGRAVLRGRVLDGAGKPVVGAVVSPTGNETAGGRGWGLMPGVDPVSVTNFRGEFLITGNKSADIAWELEIEARGFSKQLTVLPLTAKLHEIRMTEGAVVQGRILKEGKPAPGIAVGLVQCNRAAGQFVGVARIACNADGRFVFLNVHPNDEYFVYTTMGDAARLDGILLPERVSVGADGTTTEVGDRTLSPAVHRITGCVNLTDGKPVPKNTRLLLGREEAWDSQQAVLGADGSFSFAGVPEEAVTLYTGIPGYRLASKRNRFQQIRESTVAMFVDADKSRLELYFQPEAAKQAAKTGK